MGADADAHVTHLPIAASSPAAGHASRFGTLLPHERGLAAAATFIHAAGLYYVTSARVRLAQPNMELSRRSARIHTHALLADALRALRADQPLLGATLTAALEVTEQDALDREQVARLIAARRLANLRIENLWLPSSLDA